MKNIWLTADKITDIFDESKGDFDDFAIENLAYNSIEDLLSENKMTYKQAIQSINSERKYYGEILRELNINSRKLPIIWAELIKLLKANNSQDGLKLLLWLTAGGNFSEYYDDELTDKENEELKIRRYFGVKERLSELESFLETRKEKLSEFKKIMTEKINYSDGVSECGNDSERVFALLCENEFAGNCENSNILHDNIEAISRIIETNSFLKPIKPNVYLQVFVRQQNKLLNSRDYLPNIRKCFERREYGIFSNNDKNFKQYCEYCRLYILLKDIFHECDAGLCDTAFTEVSNLSEWFHTLGYMDYRCSLPDKIPHTVGTLVREMFVSCFDDEDFPETYCKPDRRMYQAVKNAVRILRFEDLREFANNKTAFCGKLFTVELSDLVNRDNHSLAWELLIYETQMKFNELLENELAEILKKF